MLRKLNLGSSSAIGDPKLIIRHKKESDSDQADKV